VELSGTVGLLAMVVIVGGEFLLAGETGIATSTAIRLLRVMSEPPDLSFRCEANASRHGTLSGARTFAGTVSAVKPMHKATGLPIALSGAKRGSPYPLA
jgi:hypothetical protein